MVFLGVAKIGMFFFLIKNLNFESSKTEVGNAQREIILKISNQGLLFSKTKHIYNGKGIENPKLIPILVSVLELRSTSKDETLDIECGKMSL